MVVGITALLLAFLGLLAMVNWLISILSYGIGTVLGISLDLSLQKILSFIYYPLTFMTGVALEDIAKVSAFLGEKDHCYRIGLLSTPWSVYK